MKLIITSILFTISQSNRLLQSSLGCATMRCAGPCFDNPYTNTPRCCPDDAICSRNDYQDTNMVVCADGNIYDNKCYGYCAGNKPQDCKPICECNPGNNDCSYGYECLETPFGFAGCDENIGNSCFGFCVSTGNNCGGVVGISQCEANEQCFYTEIFSDGRGIGYCGSLPNKCKNKPDCINEPKNKICPDGTIVTRVQPNCEFTPCPTTIPTPEPNYCGGYDNCMLFFDGCNECDCGHDGLGWPLRCEEKACDPTTLGRTYCIKCADGYELNEFQQCIKSKPNNDKCPTNKLATGDQCSFSNTKTCYWGKERCCGQTFDEYGCNCIYGTVECFYVDACFGAPEKCDTTTQQPLPPPPPIKPKCGGFKNCAVYNDGCNNCRCGLNGDACNKKFCGVDMKSEAKCIRCEYGYELNGFGTCEKIIIIEEPLTPHICVDGTVCKSGEICYDRMSGSICCDPMDDKCSVGPACGGIMGGICKPKYECVNDPNVACIYGTDPDCTGVCLWVKPTCNDGNIICKGDDICYDMSNGPVCCDPNICMSKQKCDNQGSCEYYGLKGYECVSNPMPSHACDFVWPGDSNCAGICVNPNAIVTTTPPITTTCPLIPVNPGDKCNFEGSCYWGKESCCGKTYDSFVCECVKGEALCRYTDACYGAQFDPNCEKTTKEPVVGCITDVQRCPDDTFVFRDPKNNCEFEPCLLPPPPKPKCGGFKNCLRYNDGCNDCVCGSFGDACNFMFCPEDMKSEPKCIECQYGYELKYNGECVETGIPKENKCCNPIDRPTMCMDGSACCPSGIWTCGIGNGGFSCDNGLLYPGQDKFGEICDTQNTLPPGCATILCPIGSSCCDDGFGDVKCCSITLPPPPPTNGKISCKILNNISDCDVINGYRCRPDPMCKGNGGTYKSCEDKKVCLTDDGKCNSDLDCEFEYKCVSVTETVGFCIKYQ